jgi:hypothetical protein
MHSSWFKYHSAGVGLESLEPKGEEIVLQKHWDGPQEHDTGGGAQLPPSRKPGSKPRLRAEQLPTSMLRFLIMAFGRWSAFQAPLVVCDPFCGTGSTGVAATQLGCYFMGMDNDRKLEVQYDSTHTTSTVQCHSNVPQLFMRGDILDDPPCMQEHWETIRGTEAVRQRWNMSTVR